MGRGVRRGLAVGAAAGAGSVILSASFAWACTTLATLSSGSASGRPGQQVEIVGQGYGASGDVSVRLDRADGPIVATARPDSQGAFRASVAIPDVRPGAHTLVATQAAATGTLSTPARLPLTVAATTGTRGQGSAPAAPPWALLGGVGLAATALLAAGAASLATQTSTSAALATSALPRRPPR